MAKTNHHAARKLNHRFSANGKGRPSTNGNGQSLTDGKALLTWHKLHTGVYARVAKELGVDASYVSRVAKGERDSSEVQQALIAELKRIQRLRPGA